QGSHEEPLNLLRFDPSRRFPLPDRRMQHCLPRAIGELRIVGRARLGAQALLRRARAALEGAARPALRTTYARDLSALRDRRDDMPALFLTDRAELLHALTDCVYLLLHLNPPAPLNTQRLIICSRAAGETNA